jgi:Leucine-rich repeat (LRR) protein
MKKYYLLIFLFFTYSFQAQIINIPDPAFKAKLLEASSSNFIASNETPDLNGTVATYNSIDTNADGEIQVSEASSIKYLRLNSVFMSNFEGINGFTNLQLLRVEGSFLTNINASSLTNLVFLVCSNNTQLATINVTGLTNLKSLLCVNNILTNINVGSLTSLQNFHCSGNQLTSLDVSNLSNLKNFSCSTNPLPILNVSGLTNLENLTCFENNFSSLDVSTLTNLRSLICYDGEIANLNVSGLTNLEVLDCHSNQISNLNLSALTNLVELNCGFNQLTNIDLTSLINLEKLICNLNQLSSLDISNCPSLNWLDCSSNQITSLNLKNNGIDWYILTFNTNFDLVYVCSDDADLTLIQTKVNAYGYLSTCQVNSYCSFAPGGTYYTIEGNNKFDENSNGCDATDGFYSNLKFAITDGTISGTIISNSSGNYAIPVSAGTHTVAPQFENPSYFTSSPISASVTFPATTSSFNQNFCITSNGVHYDLEVVVIPLEPARPGFDATYKIKYKNKGNQNEMATVVFNYSDSVLDYISATLAPTTSSSGSLSWNIGTVAPFQSGEFVVTLNVNSPMETPAVNGGDILNYTAVINGLFTDETPVDNTATLNQTVVNSFDPNDKTCLEGTTINPSMIGQYVHYQIRFENTGTFPAENIVVKDMIDTTKFDITTLQITDASHSCVTRITNINQVEFIFEDINLPFDDATNDGYVVFKIKTKPTLVVGNTISNLANIYFDYNFPIVTNTATSTFQVLGTNEFGSNNTLTLYPIPVKDHLNFSLKNNEITSSISIYNLLGQLIQTVTNPSNSIDVSNLQSGSYLIKVTTDKGISSGKFVKE